MKPNRRRQRSDRHGLHEKIVLVPGCMQVSGALLQIVTTAYIHAEMANSINTPQIVLSSAFSLCITFPESNSAKTLEIDGDVNRMESLSEVHADSMTVEGKQAEMEDCGDENHGTTI